MESPTPPEDVARLRSAIERADAPAALRLEVARRIARARARRARRRKISIAAVATGGALAAGVATLGSGGSGQPSVEQIVQVAAAARQAPAPPVDATHPRRLTAHVDHVWFPSWRGLRWRAVGRSSKTVAGRTAVTVYYARDDRARIAYTIVGGGPLRWPEKSRAVERGGMRLHVYADDGRRVVTWRERGHQCVIAGPRSLRAAALLALAWGEA